MMCSASDDIQYISTNGVQVLGVTTVDDELFLLLNRNYDQIAVYAIAAADYRLLGTLSLPGHYNEIASCGHHKCLYACTSGIRGDKSVHRYDMRRKDLSKWAVNGFPQGLSVTADFNLLVTSRSPNKLVLMSGSGGRCLREISLDVLDNPSHGVQLFDSRFIVCHRDPAGVSKVSLLVVVSGMAAAAVGRQDCTAGLLEWPHHLAVDANSRKVFVADLGRRRVVQLSPSATLEYERIVVDGMPAAPRRLCFHPATRRLFVAPLFGDGRLAVIQT